MTPAEVVFLAVLVWIGFRAVVTSVHEHHVVQAWAWGVTSVSGVGGCILFGLGVHWHQDAYIACAMILTALAILSFVALSIMVARTHHAEHKAACVRHPRRRR